MQTALKEVETANLTADPSPGKKIKEVRDPFPTLFRWLWHCYYFVNTLLFNFFGKTRLFPHAHEEYNPNTFRNKITGRLKDRLDKRLHEIAEEMGPGQILELPRVKDISPEELYKNYIYPNKPVVLEGAAKDWPCTKKWNLDFFQNSYGDQPIMVSDGVNWSYKGTVEEMYKTFDTVADYTVADLIEDAKKGGNKYATFYPFLRHHPELYDDFNIPWLENYFNMKKYLPWQRKFYPKLFLGGAGTSTSLHCAGIINLNVQIYGEKEWVLFHNRITPFLYPAHEIANNSGTQIDFRNPDVETFPLYKHADQYRTVLKAGDVIFVPAWWWHACYNRTASISTSNFILRWRSAAKGGALYNLAVLDPWTIATFLLGNEDAAKEHEMTLPKILYSQRSNYLGQLASFAHFLYATTAKKLGLRKEPRPQRAS